MKSKFSSSVAATVAIAMISSSTAATAAPRVSRTLALAGACTTSLGAAGTVAAQAIRPGCVLPAIDAPAPAPVGATAPPPAYDAGKGFTAWPLLAGLAAILAAYFLLKGDDDDDEEDLSPG